MIRVDSLTKKFDGFTALNDISCTIPDGCVYGLVGSNGAGKSTFIRLLAGIYKPDKGKVMINGASVFENPAVKNKLVLVPDDLYFLSQSNMNKMAELYAAVYKNFSYPRFEKLTDAFGLDPKNNISNFSKGMRRQAVTILALSSMPEYLFFDETFDGLDPVMRNLVKSVIYSDVCGRKTTVIITSHSLRELEDTCDQLAMLHEGGVVFESDIQNLKTSLFKIQIAFDEDFNRDRFTGLDLLSFSKTGRVASLIARGNKEQTLADLKSMNPVLLDVLPLSLEEVFVYEMDALGYSVREMIN
ncbi:MAG TPA: ABC transporter ATP-binding protein [Clostridia bacterium]|nr:ABC transporter ATP-binding protein [Clostridia bacterium]